MTDVQSHLERLAAAPADPEAIEAVESAYRGEGRWEELLRVYEENAARVDKEQAGPLLRKAAIICMHELSSAPRAEAYFKRAIEAVPADVESLKSLREIYMAQGNYEDGVAIYEKELARTKDAEVKSNGLVEVADIYRDQLQRPEKALPVLRQALRADKGNPAVHRAMSKAYEAQGRLDQAQKALLQELEVGGSNPEVLGRLGVLAERLLERPRLHEKAREAAEAVLAESGEDSVAARVKAELESFSAGWQQRIIELQQRANYLAASDPVQSAEVWLSVAEVQLVYGEQTDAALASVDQALLAKPGHPGALRLMEDIYGDADRYGELAMKLEMMAAYTRDPATAVDLYLKAALHNAVRLDSPDTAARLYVRVLELDPGNKVASNALTEYYRERKEWDHALQVLGVWAERATQANDKVAAHYAICRILEEELGDKVRARPHYEAILALDPENQAAARALEEVYREAGDHAPLAKALHAKLAGLQGDARQPVLQELGELYAGPLEMPKEALATLGELYTLAPTAELREQLEERAAMAGDFSSLVTYLEGGLDRIEAEDDKIQALHSIAALYEGAREAPLEALRIHRRILGINAEDDRAKQAVGRLMEVAAQSGDKIAFYREQAEAATSDDEKVDILNRLATELVETAKDYVRALDVYGEIRTLDPDNAEALNGLLTLYRRDNRWAEVADILQQKVTTAEGADKLAIELELAGILETHLDNVDAAVDHYQAVLDHEPGNILAIAGLERLLNRSRKTNQIAKVLEPHYRGQERWDAVVTMLEIRVREGEDSEERVANLHELAKVYENNLSQPADALTALLRAFQAEPSRGEVRRDLERVAQSMGEYTGVIRSYRAAALVSEAELGTALLMRAGSLSEQLGDSGAAVLDYMRLLGRSDSATAASLDGLTRLKDGGVEVSKFREASTQVIESAEEIQRPAIQRHLARFYETELNEAQEAIKMWKAIVENNPEDTEAVAELDRLFENASDPSELVSHLRQKIADTGDDAERARLGLQLVEVMEDKLQDLQGAAEALAEISDGAPGQRSLLNKLAELYDKLDMGNEAAQAMHKEINLLPEGDERQERLVAYARILGLKLGDIDGALGALQGVTAQQSDHPGATEVLEQLTAASQDPAQQASIAQPLLESYRQAGRWEEVVTLNTSRLEHLTDADQRLSALREIASTRADKLNDAAGAYAVLEQGFREAPLDESVRMELERLAEAAGTWENLAEAYNAALGAIADPEAQKPIRRKLAEVLDQRLGRGAEAVEHYKAVSGGDLPADLGSLEAMERLLREQNNFAELVEVLNAMLHHIPAEDAQRRTGVMLELATLCEQQLADKARAVDVYRNLLAAEPKNVDALRNMERLLGELNQPAELAEILGRLVELGTANPELVDDYVKHADALVALDQPEDALQSYRAALLKKREHPGALQGLENLIERVENKLEIAQVLEPIYTAKQDHEKLAWVLERRLDGTDDRVQRKGLLRRIGDIYENRLNLKDRAFAMARRSLNEDPSDMGVRMWIEKLAGETGALRELADAYVEEAEKAEPPLNLQFHRRAASLYHEKLNDSAAAVAQYRAILELEERDEKSLTGLESIFRQTENWSELVTVLKHRLIQTAGVERKREYLQEIATIQAAQLTDVDAAVETYREILEITPDDPEPFGQIENLLATNSRWDELIQVYRDEESRLAEKVGRDVAVRRLELTFRRGRVVDEQFGDRAAAADVFQKILAEEPNHASTVTYLEENAQNGVAESIALLESLYSEQAQWQKFVQLLEVKLQHTAETERRREIYVSVAETYEQHLEVGDMAFQTLTRAFNENRADLDLLDKLEGTAEKFGHWEPLVQVLGVDLDAVADPVLRQDLLRRLGDICGNKLGDADRAIAYLQQALQYDPRDDKALGALDTLLETNEKWAALADVIERRVEVAQEPSEKSLLLERLASVWGDRLMDAEAALRCHQQILEIDPDHPISLKSMQKLYAEVQDWDSLAKNLQRQAEVLTEPEDQVRIHAAAGELYAEELNEISQAIDHYLAVVDIEPTHEVAVQALDVLLAAEERWADLADHLRRQLSHAQETSEKLDINRRLGVILGEKLGQGDDALTSWEDVLAGDAKNVEAMRALLDLYSERARWEDFVGVARKLIPLVDPHEAKEVRYRLAEALGEALGERDEAIKLAREVRATEPHTAEQMVRLGTMLGNIEAWDEAVMALEKAAPLEEEDGVKVERYYQAAEIYRDRLEKPNEARGAYEAILELQPEDRKAYLLLAEVYRATEEWRTLVALNESYVPYAEPEERLQILTEIRDVQDQRLGEKELAFIAACRVYKENPMDLEAAGILERIALETDGAEEAAAVLEDELEAVVDTGVKIELYRQIARIYAEELTEVPSAEEMLQKILELDPADVRALDQLAGLGASEERYDKQISALERKLEQVDDEDSRKAILFEIARIWEQEIGDTDEAINALNRVLEFDGVDQTALNSLSRVFEMEQRWTELAHTLTRKVEITQDSTENVELRMRVAQLCEGELGDAEAGIQWYRGVLEFDQGHAGALAALDRLYTGLERWSELIQVFELQIAKAATSEEQISLLSKMASIYESEFSSPKDAAACYERVYELDSTHLASVRNLERLLRQLGEWNRLIEVLEHHITLLSDTEEITDLYLQIGEIYYRELSRVDKAEQVYNKAREFNQNSDAALAALGQLYERSGNWFQSLEMLQREVDAKPNDPSVLPVLMRIGKMNEDMLMDIGAAQNAYRRALEIDPSYLPALAAMKDIAHANESWDEYAEYLTQEAEVCDDEEEQTELFIEAAKFFMDVREDEMSAIRYYQRALEITPGQLDASRALAEVFFRNEMWEEAGDMYQVVVASLDKTKDAKDFCQKNYRLGYISEKLGDEQKALEFYRQAFEADATYLPALEGLGQALLAVEDWEEAQKVFQTILIHHRDSLTESEVVDVQAQLGEICMKQNQPDRAYRQYEKALEIDPDHAASLSALSQLDEQNSNWESAYGRLSRLGNVAPGPERVQVLMRMSMMATEHLGSTERAMEPLERARKTGQSTVEMLERLADLYLETNQGQRAVEVLEDAAEKGEDPQKISDINFKLGWVLENEIKHEPLAVQKYNAALDAAPTNIQAFESIERILGNRQEWALLEENYRAMIGRSQALTPKVRLVLWRNLGELYRQVLKNVDSAIMAYEVIQKMDPGRPEDVSILAELYASKPEKRAQSITMQHELLLDVDNPVQPIRGLRKLYHADQDFDSVYVMCNALAFLNEADEEEKQIFEYLAKGVPQRATRGLVEDHWKLLKHPGLDNPIGQLATVLYRSAPDALTRPAKDLGLRKKDYIDVRTSDLYFANMMRYVGKVLNLHGVDLFRKGGSMEPLHLANSQPPSLVAGENNEIFRDTNQRVVLFHIGRNLAYSRPELFLARIHPGDDLRDMLFGLCIIYNRSLQHNGHPTNVEGYAQMFERLPQPTLKRLQPLVMEAYNALVAQQPFVDYLTAVEHTAARAGLVAAGDLASAVRGVTTVQDGAMSLENRVRVKELVLFWVSHAHLQLRKLTGAALVTGNQPSGGGAQPAQPNA